jgi:hypothetical protein
LVSGVPILTFRKLRVNAPTSLECAEQVDRADDSDGDAILVHDKDPLNLAADHQYGRLPGVRGRRSPPAT